MPSSPKAKTLIKGFPPKLGVGGGLSLRAQGLQEKLPFWWHQQLI